MEKREPSCTTGGNVNWYSCYGERYGGSLKKLKIELPYDPAIPLLGIYPEKRQINLKRHMHPSVHSSTVYNSQDMETTQVPATDNWLRRCGVYTHTHTKWNISHKKEGNIVIWSNMDRPREYHIKWSKSEKDKYNITCMWNLKNNTDESIYKTGTDSQT